MSKSANLIQIVENVSLADSAARREINSKFSEVSGSLAKYAAELAATKCAARETVLVMANPSPFTMAAAESNSIEIFDRPPTAGDLIAVAAGDELSKPEYLMARKLTGKDFIQLSGFVAADDKIWESRIAELQDFDLQITAADLSELIDQFHAEPIVELATQIATALARQIPVIVDGGRALLAASIVYEYSVAARSWLFVADLPKSAAGQQLFRHRNWISFSANQVATGDGLAAIAALSLARTAALLLRR